MLLQIWIQCQKRDVQSVKSVLDDVGQLSREKVRFGAKDGYMVIPTNLNHDHEVDKELSKVEALEKLGLRTTSLDREVEVIYLPSPLAREERTQAKTGIINEAVLKWLESLLDASLLNTGFTTSELVSQAPKRWSVYEPMLLLPSTSFQSPAWTTLLQSVDETLRQKLWKRILTAVWKKEGGNELTRLAINSGIPLNKASCASDSGENILRSPSGLVTLYGDFGPDMTEATEAPTEMDFGKALWVSTKQNGIYQIWAPRYTMFSRGNIKEKARLLSFHDPIAPATTLARRRVSTRHLSDAAAVDLYAGIGYFSFSYVQMGMGRILCWEINPWSVEGLRRGLERNGWGYRIVRGKELERPLWEVLCDVTVRVVVFEENNERAADRIEELRMWEKQRNEKVVGDVLHVNCGFLPSSEASWGIAWKILCKRKNTWLHLHENVGVEAVESRRREIEGKFRKWAAIDECCPPVVEVEHVELVKTFAPGVWHCVFDLHIQPALAGDL